MIQRRRIELPSGGFSYLEAGDPQAPLVLCVHGFPDHAWTFQHLLTDLAQYGFHGVAPWLRGYAPSTLSGSFDMNRISEDLAELVLALSPRAPAAIVGHDWGALATYYALRTWPKLFSRAVTLAVPHPVAFARNLRRYPGQLKKSWYMMFFQLPFLPERVVPNADFAFIERLWRDWSPGFTPDPGYMKELKRCLRVSMPKPIQYYRAAIPRMPGLEALMTPLTVPTLYLHGETDGCVSPQLGQGQNRYFDTEFHSENLAQVGHFLHLEAPRQVNSQIVQWLDP